MHFTVARSRHHGVRYGQSWGVSFAVIHKAVKTSVSPNTSISSIFRPSENQLSTIVILAGAAVDIHEYFRNISFVYIFFYNHRSFAAFLMKSMDESNLSRFSEASFSCAQEAVIGARAPTIVKIAVLPISYTYV